MQSLLFLPKLDIPSSGCPGLYLLCAFFKFLCRSLLIVAEKTNVRISNRGGNASTFELFEAAEAKSSSYPSSNLSLKNGFTQFSIELRSNLVQGYLRFASCQSYDTLQLGEMSILNHSICLVNHEEFDSLNGSGKRIILQKKEGELH